MSRTGTSTREVSVIHGANTVRHRVAPGTFVHGIRTDLGRQLRIPAGTPALLDGQPVGDNAKIGERTGTVEFLQPAGELG